MNKMPRGYYKKGNRYLSSVKVCGRKYLIGSFKTKEEAREEYLKVFKEWFGYSVEDYVNRKRDTKHPLYKTWVQIKRRCRYTKHKQYNEYGGRGIGVCDNWHDNFWNFVNDIGERPSSHHSIDRIDNNKGYFKENCRWAMQSLQVINSRRRFRDLPSGVYHNKQGGKPYMSKITIFNKVYLLGKFQTIDEALFEYRKIYKEWYGFNY